MYKLFKDSLTNTYSIQKVGTQISFLPDPANREYQQFVDDIYANGTKIVEGADYVGVTTYTDARAAEYPPIVDQLDKIYHSGVDAWKADIKIIKDKYPKTQVGITSVASIPDWVNTALFEKQKEKYVEAVARLAQYELANGLKGVVGTENVWDSTSSEKVSKDIIDYVIEPLPLIVDGERNPLVVADEAERAAAQTIVNNTPQAVIDSINT